MQLFSTLLDIKEGWTKEEFVNFVIRWCQGSPHPQNIIPDMHWDGTFPARFGNDRLWMEIENYRNRNIVAVRYEKKDDNNAIWDSDYVMNFDTWKMGIRLDRSYQSDVVSVDPAFSTPHIITMLSDEGHLKDDGLLPVSKNPFFITKDNAGLLADIINGRSSYRFPVVYVSKTPMDKDPVNVSLLASRLKGAAHVLVQQSIQSNQSIRDACNSKNDYYGAIGVYYPTSAVPHKRFLSHDPSVYDSFQFEKVVRSVIRFANIQQMDKLYTWQGVRNELLSDRLAAQRSERIQAETDSQEKDDMLAMAYDDYDRLKAQIEELKKENDKLTQENYGLHAKLDSSESVPLIYAGEEDDLYPGEIKDLVLLCVSEELKKSHDKSRRFDVCSDILKANNYQRITEKNRNLINKEIVSYSGMNESTRSFLSKIGIRIHREGNHPVLNYYGDNRYQVVLGSTPSDHGHGGENAAKMIIRTML